MHQRNLRLLDLPNEILFIIMKKLNNVDVLYSLLNINNRRLHAIAHAEIFTKCLNFDSISSTDHIFNDILDRFCNEILPQIHHNIKHLIVDSLSMERILRAAHYPHLTQLKLLNVNKQIMLSYFNANSIFQSIHEQITDLHLITTENRNGTIRYHYTRDVYELILLFFKSLKHLTIVPLSHDDDIPVSLKHLPSTAFFPSTLTKLDIYVECFDDCLGLLDGRLKQLTTFIVEIAFIESDLSVFYNRDDLPNMKRFSLTCYYETSSYDSRVVPLLHRMSHLEELTLYVYISDRPTFVDGIHLHNDILVHMPRLHKFIFYINTEIMIDDPVDHLSNDDIQRTFSNINHVSVASILDSVTDHKPTCQIFSLPFSFNSLKWLTNNLPPIIFYSVTHLSLCATTLFEHAFFIQLAQSFPSLKYLIIENLSSSSLWAYNHARLAECSLSIVEYPHLISLTLHFLDRDYVDEFLNESKAHLPSLTELKIRYSILVSVTYNFRRDATRRNCAKVKQLSLIGSVRDSLEKVYLYFPSLVSLVFPSFSE